MSGLLDPIIKKEIVGTAEVLEVFNSPKFGQVAGCNVIEGNVLRNKPVRVLRDDIVIFEGELNSLDDLKKMLTKLKMAMNVGWVLKTIKILDLAIKLKFLIEKKKLKKFRTHEHKQI